MYFTITKDFYFSKAVCDFLRDSFPFLWTVSTFYIFFLFLVCNVVL